MGGGRWNDDDWSSYSTSHIKGRSVTGSTGIYKNTDIDDELNPLNISTRESRDSGDNPNSNALIVALDVTGSMSSVLDSMAKKGLNKLSTEIYDRKPITDPHIMYMGVGDVKWDHAPLQATQFEADIRIAEQLTKIWLEQGGGGNGWESYNLPWYFALMNTSIDCFVKRNKKGYIFTVGDEGVPENLTPEQIKKVFGRRPEYVHTNEALIEALEKKYNIYHIIVEEGYHYRTHSKSVDIQWRNLLGERVLNLSDHTKMSEVIVSTIQMNEGVDADEVINSWDGSTSVVVGNALKNTSITTVDDVPSGIVTFK